MRLLPHLVITISLAFPTPASAGELREKNFAYGLELEPDGSDAVQTVLLPVDLYRGVVREDLGDVRVFNSQGLVVPHAIRSLARPTTEAATTLKLPFFPLRGPANILRGDLSLHVQRSDAGTIIDIKSEGESDGEAAPQKVVAYLLDASAVKGEIRELSLRWAPARSFMAQVDVAASDELSMWVMAATGTSIAQLDYQGHSLERRVVRLSSRRTKYLRITWKGDDPPFELTEVTATLRREVHEPERRSIYLEGTADEKEPNLFHFDAGGPIPVDRISFNLPQRNTLAEVELQSTATRNGKWSTRYRGFVYRLAFDSFDGQEISNERIEPGRTTDRYWRLRVDPKGGGLGGGTPSMEIFWLPQQLLFVARGDPPYHLTYGSYKAEPSTFDAASLLALVPGQNVDDLAEQSVHVGARRILGGEVALQAPVPPTPWALWTLWGLLVFAVLLLGWMVVRLVRQLDQPGGEDGGTSDAG